MSWSLLTPKVRATFLSREAQRNEPGINAVDNCGPACGSALMQLLGYPDIEPEDWVGSLYRGGTTGPQLNAFIASHYPNPPPMTYVSSVDPLADLARWAAQGYLAMGLFWSDDAAVVKPYNTGIGHWCIPVEDDGTAITIWNPEWGSFDRLSHADFLAASWRQFDVCQRDIRDQEASMSFLVYGNGDDPRHGKNATYVTDGVEAKRYLSRQSEVDDHKKAGLVGPVLWDQFTLDRIPETVGVPIGQQGSVVMDYNALLAAIAAIKPSTGATVDLQPVLDAIHGLTLKASA